MKAEELLQINKIIPVISINDASKAIKLAQALFDGGIKVLEITLRTKEALEAIKIIAKELPHIIVGAGTVLNEKQLEQVKNAGAKFAISPGLTPNLAKQAKNFDMAFIPGVASASELMFALEFEFKALKFFPAEAAGGINMLKSFESPFNEAKFCPTGGININNASEYLKLNNVLCAGGSWLSPKELIENNAWDKITELAKQTQNI